MYRRVRRLPWTRLSKGADIPQLVKVGVLYERLGEDAVNEIAAWLDQVYDAKAEMDALRRDVQEVLREVRAIHLKLCEDLPPARFSR